MGDEQAGAGEGLQDLGQQGRRDVVGLGDILCTLRGGGALGDGGVRGGLLGQVLERHETVVGFFGQTQHSGPS